MGDIQNTASMLRKELRSISYPWPLNWHGMLLGDTASLIPILCYCLYQYSDSVRKYVDSPYENMPVSDVKRYMKGLYQVLRNKFEYVPKINLEEFIGNRNVESKLSTVVDVIQIVKNKHDELERNRKMCRSNRSVSNSPSKAFQSPTRNIQFRPPSTLPPNANLISKSLFCYDSPSKSTEFTSVSVSPQRRFTPNSSIISVVYPSEDDNDLRRSVSQLKEEVAIIRQKLHDLESLTKNLMSSVSEKVDILESAICNNSSKRSEK